MEVGMYEQAVPAAHRLFVEIQVKKDIRVYQRSPEPFQAGSQRGSGNFLWSVGSERNAESSLIYLGGSVHAEHPPIHLMLESEGFDRRPQFGIKVLPIRIRGDLEPDRAIEPGLIGFVLIEVQFIHPRATRAR